MKKARILIAGALLLLSGAGLAQSEKSKTEKEIYGGATFLNKQDDGYRGIWYMINGAGQAGPVENQYRFKYSGGMATYPANHYPFSIYVPEVNKTFFCYGGTDKAEKTLYHMVSYFDHSTGMVPKPTIVIDRGSSDAHENPVMQVDRDGYIWIFSTSHGTARPSFIHKSKKPYDISDFERVPATKIVNGKKVPLDNFSYLQVYYSDKHGFTALFTHYEKKGGRVIGWMTSEDGVEWSEWKDLSFLGVGQYQSSANRGETIGSAFNYHPARKVRGGLDFRTNLYFLQSKDFGKSWQSVDGTPMEVPLTEVDNKALVHDYDSEKRNVYVIDVNFDKKERPVILYLTSKGPMPGPEDGPRNWHTAYWTGKKWDIQPFTSSGNNYDFGSLYIEKGKWVVIAPTTTGPQEYNTGGEMVMWKSSNKGKTWKKVKDLTWNSEFNHTFARRPVNVHPDFYAFWADGHARQHSESRLYFSDKKGNVFMLPEVMDKPFMKPIPVYQGEHKKTSSSLSKEFVDKQLSSAVSHYKILMEHAPETAFPRTWEDGKLKTSGSGGWISGFYPGTLLYLYEFSGDKSLLAEAEQKLTVLEKEKNNTGTHDLGFMLYCSFGNALRLTGNASYRDVLLKGTESLSARFDPEVGCIRSWGKIDGKKDFLVIIDNMMNLEMMTWASRVGGNDKYRDIAVTHANTTMANHFRPDFSSYHVVNYNQQDGSVLQKKTAQGNADSSAWARGQAWGLYGYTMMGRETGKKEYLELARNIADFILSHENLPEDGVPYWDFDAPGIPDAKRDASSGSIIASALLELSRLSKGEKALTYKQAAEKILRSLSSPAYMTEGGEAGGFLLKHGVGALPHKSEVDVPLSYGDYYYVEALMRYRDWYL